jgi:hypothetical protein
MEITGGGDGPDVKLRTGLTQSSSWRAETINFEPMGGAIFICGGYPAITKAWHKYVHSDALQVFPLRSSKNANLFFLLLAMTNKLLDKASQSWLPRLLPHFDIACRDSNDIQEKSYLYIFKLSQ